MSNQDIQILTAFDISTIIDLRNTTVATASPSSFIDKDAFRCFNFAIADGLASPKTEEEFIQMYYSTTQNKPLMLALFKTMANCDGGVFFHCQEGKDRTGVISAILLSLANVFEDDICADYQVSATYFREHIKLALAAWKDMPVFLVDSKAEYMEQFLSLFYEKHGSAHEYLRFLGVNDCEIGKLTTKLVERNE